MSDENIPENTVTLAEGASEALVLEEHEAEMPSISPEAVVILPDETVLPGSSSVMIDENTASTSEDLPESGVDTDRVQAFTDVAAVSLDQENSIKEVARIGEASAGIVEIAPGRTRNTEPLSPLPIDVRKTRVRKGMSKRQKVLILGLVLILLALLIVPAVMTINAGISAYTTYKQVHDRAYSGYHHFLNLKPVLASMKAHPTSAITPANLKQIQSELSAARADFTQVQRLLRDTPVIQTVKEYLPQYRTQIATVESGSTIGIDVADIGLRVTDLGMSLAPRLQGSLLSTASTPLITAGDLEQIRATINGVKPLLNDIQGQSHNLTLDALPLSQSQRAQVSDYLSLLPQVQSMLTQSDSLLDAAGWILGVNGPRTLLVQPMDRGELRATGGFTGQYGELTLKQGRVEPFSMRNIALLEYTDTSTTNGQTAPAAYQSWWPFANWGLRDSNLSADFPTSAKIAINLYKKEAGRDVDGVVMLTPFAIEDVLKVTGPVYIAQYNETITAQNLEDRLHYYQLGKGIDKQKEITHLTDDNAARKQFTSELAHVLMDTVRHAHPDTLLQIGKQLLYDLKTRDLQVYVTNPQIEGMLVQYGYAGLLDRSAQRDGLYIVQSNVSASKASQYVRTVVHDSVQLDEQGGATHALTMQLIYNQTGPVYGLDTYRDYVRIYVPTGAILRNGDGFASNQPLCGGPLGPCASDNVYPQNELVCPSGQYDAGYAAPMLNDLYDQQDHPLDTVGKPTNLQSDEPGRGMFAGYVVIPKNCTATITLSWYVPPVEDMGYQLLIQRQAGTYPDYQLTISPPVIKGCQLAPVKQELTLQEDLMVSLRSLLAGEMATQHCAASVLS